MNPKDIALVAAKARYDLFFLAKYILGYSLMEEAVHGELCRYTEALLPSHPADYVPPKQVSGKDLKPQFKAGNKNLLLLMPRGSFKSSVVTIGFSLQVILNEPNARILIDSETYGQAKSFLSEIKGHLESNEAYREVFKSIHGLYPNEVRRKADLLWSDSQLNIAARTRPIKEPTFSVAGVDVTKTGMHYDLIIMDDLHSEKNVTSGEQIKQVINHWRLAYSLLDPGKPLIVVGTRWHFLDLYNHILTYERHRFNILVKSAIKQNGKLFFPARLSQEFLDDVRETQGTAIFSKQYLNNPVDDASATFKLKDMVRKPWELVKDIPINWYMMVDPSYEGPYSDFSALVIAGMDHMRNLYVRYILRKKMTYAELVNHMFDLNSRFSPRTILLETIFSQKSILYFLNDEQKNRGAWLPVREIKSRSKSKEERIRGLAPYYETGRAIHVKECPAINELELELSQFPYGEHDDIIDALSTILEIATPPSSQTREIKDKPKQRIKPRSPITGY